MTLTNQPRYDYVTSKLYLYSSVEDTVLILIKCFKCNVANVGNGFSDNITFLTLEEGYCDLQANGLLFFPTRKWPPFLLKQTNSLNLFSSQQANGLLFFPTSEWPPLLPNNRMVSFSSQQVNSLLFLHKRMVSFSSTSEWSPFPLQANGLLFLYKRMVSFSSTSEWPAFPLQANGLLFLYKQMVFFSSTSEWSPFLPRFLRQAHKG
jgi:hypothetical protein